MSSPPGPAQRIVELADQCVKCGLCLPHCPTYAADRNEGESPRGRIALASALATGRLPFAGQSLEHIDSCLSCRACERVCPPGVRYGELLQATRGLIADRRGLPPALRRLRWMLQRPWRLQIGLSLLRLLRRSGLARITERLGLSPAVDALPTPPPRQRLTTGDGAGKEVILFLGCVARRYDADAHVAAIQLLEACGYRVRIPEGQGCCGAVMAHGGDRGGAEAAKASLIARLHGDAPVLVSASGCMETMRQTLDARARDIHTFLAEDAAFAKLRFRPLPSRMALHLPCTLRNVGDGGVAVKALLARIPELELAPLPDQGRCCGAAGIQFLERPAQAKALRAVVLDDIRATAAESLCTANVGCRLWLQAGLTASPTPLSVHHPLHILARQLDLP